MFRAVKARGRFFGYNPTGESSDAGCVPDTAPSTRNSHRPNRVERWLLSFRTWLCPAEQDTARFVEMHRRVPQARRIQGAAVGGAAALSSIWYGPGMLLLAVLAAVVLGLLEKPRHHVPPEVASAASIFAFELLIVVGIGGTGGAFSPILPSSVIPTIMLGARFRPKVVVMGVAVSVVMTGAALWLATFMPRLGQASAVAHILWYIVMLISVVAAAAILLTSDIRARGEAQLDPLTGLLNRKALTEQLVLMTPRPGTEGSPVAVLVCDIDHFKIVNDTLGHAMGDRVLVEVANRVRSCLRIEDKIFRYGGEEFVVILSAEIRDNAEAIASRILQAVSASPIAETRVTVSVGVATATNTSVSEFDPASLIYLADKAMYAAKGAGRNQVWHATDPGNIETPFENCGPGS